MTTIANTILSQLGGARFCAMTGAKNLLNGGDYLQFDLGRGALNKATKCRVRLTENDLYTVTFYKWNRKALTMDVISETDGVFFDDLQRIFTGETGFATKL
ncbi:hypothetical protein EVC29_121 [Rhizobium phage RHph_Y52]|nr:hypothetical protein EVC16_121 [Rhizobium phage RHph_Y21]QIG76822.1 hypothetical protein EVC29_121 [Rhizobium phage RHph_Y52]